jgi:hypothetical protein
MKHVKLFEDFNRPAMKGTFSLDEKSYDGYTFGEKWNGFECPYFEKDVADQIMKDMDGRFENDTYKFEGSEDFEPQDIDTEDGKKKVWAIGAYSWTWSN